MQEALKIEKVTGICGRCQVRFQNGDVITSAVIETPEGLARRNFCAKCWASPPEQVFASWKTVYPEPVKPNIDDMNKVQKFFDKLMEKTDVTAEIEAVRFFTALVLARKKRVKLLGTKSEGGRTALRVEKNWDSETVEVIDPGITEEGLGELRSRMEELFQMELSEAPPPVQN